MIDYVNPNRGAKVANDTVAMNDDAGKLNELFGAGTSSVAGWTYRTTFGQVKYVPAGAGLYHVKPSAAVVSLLGQPTCPSSVLNAESKEASSFLAARHVSYQRMVVFSSVAGCGSLGRGGGGKAWVGLYSGRNFSPTGESVTPSTGATDNTTEADADVAPRSADSTLVHELGHAYGFPHPPYIVWPNGTDPGASAETGSIIGATPMSYDLRAGTKVGYDSPELTAIGVIPNSWQQNVTANGTYAVQPLFASTLMKGPRVIHIDSGSQHFMIECRLPETRGDSYFATNQYGGLRMYVKSDVSGQKTSPWRSLLAGNGQGPTAYIPVGTVFHSGPVTIKINDQSHFTVSGL